MENSKLLELLRTFSPRDWRNFRLFAASPYFNRSEEVVRYLNWLETHAGQWEGMDKKAGFGSTFLDTSFDDKRFNHLQSAVFQMASQFLAQENLRKQSFWSDYFQAAAFFERQLDKHFKFQFEKTDRQLDDEPQRDARHFLQKYLLNDLKNRQITRQDVRRFNESLQYSADSLDYFYLTEKLKYTVEMLNSQTVVSASYNLILVEELRRHLEATPMPAEAPGVGIYYRVLRLLTLDAADEDFRELIRLLEIHRERFEAVELSNLYQYAINYCIRQIRKVREPFVEEAFNLYRRGIESGILLENGTLSAWHFKNTVKLALRLAEFEWVEKFIREKSGLLLPEFRRDALYFNLAELYYYTRQFDKAQINLNKVEFTDIHYNLDAKTMLAKIYHELDSEEALSSLLHAFTIFLRRNKIISEDVRKTYLNFIRLLQKVIKMKPGARESLRKEIEQTGLLTEKNWLLEQVR